MLLLLLGCPTDPDPVIVVDTATTPDPWAALEAIPLEAFRDLMVAPLEGASSPTRLRTLPDRSLTAILDGPEVLVLDPLYHQTSAGFCVSASEWPDWGHAERQGDCQDGSAYIQRGRLIPAAPAVDVAVDTTALTITVLTAAGTLQVADADLLTANPLDYLRLGDPVETGLGPLGSSSLLAVSDGEVAIASDAVLLMGKDIIDLPGTATALAWIDGGIWALTDGGLWVDGTEVSISGQAMAVSTSAVWIGAAGSLSRIDRSSLDVETFDISGATGPVAVDGERVYAATEDGIAVLEDGTEIARHLLDSPTDLAVGPPNEIIALVSTDVRIYLDETALEGEDVLDVVMTAFIEQPRNEKSDVECRGEGSTITGYVEQAVANCPMLDDLPLPATVGITPFFAQRAAQCDLLETLRPLIDRVEPGVLFHTPTPECGEDCLIDWLIEDAAYVTALGVEPTWASGLAAKDDLTDFVDLLRQSGGPDRYLFFGLSALPDISHNADPRSKNSWPVETGRRSEAWSIAHASELQTGTEGGWLTVYPGDNIPLFNLGGCPNLLLRECHQLGLGGISTIDEDDTLALTLLLHRALVDRSGPSTFTFHLPDLGVYSYVSGCEVEDRIWSGEDCQVAILQDWALSVYQRYTLNGLARLSLPSDLERPE